MSSQLYDKGDWHYGGDFPAGLPDAAGVTHIGLFFAWAATRGLAGELHTVEFAEDLAALIERRVLPGEAAARLLDERLTDEDFSTEGNAFAAVYYGPKGYYDDLEKLSDSLGVESIYHIPDGWPSFDELAPVLDRRFKRWKSPNLFERLFRK